jgi:hypothetical protein
MNLPTSKNKPTTENPKLLILFGKPKSGKTTIMAALDENLIIDMEDGSNYVECMSVKAKNIDELKEISSAIREAGCPYKYITLDTITALEDIILPLALSDYRSTPMGKSFGLNQQSGKYEYLDIRTLPNGGGYLYIREAFQKVVNIFRGLADHIILIGHTKDRTINRDGKELSENLLDLSGKLERIISSKADALGYVYRKKNQTIINFNGGDDLVVEARPAHLRGKEIVIAESDENGVITTYWDRIFK